MHIKHIKATVTFLVLVLLSIFSGTPAFAAGAAGTADEGDILVHLRLYEGSRGNEISNSSVVSSYYLKPLFVSSMITEFNIRVEENELKRIFNLNNIKLMTRTQWGWKRGEPRKRFRIVVLNGHEFLVQLTMEGEKDRFKMEVIDKGTKKQEILLETRVVLPEKKSTVFGFEDSLGKPFFICLQREENKSVIDKEPVHGPFGSPKLVTRVKPEYPEAALKKKIHGQVLLDAVVDEQGNVSDVYLVDGFVVTAESKKGYGNLLIIDHGYGYSTRYAELSAFNVKEGDRVKRGQVIGFVGSSGSGGEPHLHYEVHYMEKPVNPMTIMRDK